MRYVILIASILILTLPTKANDMFDVDYNFIDTAFDGIQPVSDKEFNNTIDKLTPVPVEDTFKDKVRTFFFGRKTQAQVKKPQQEQTEIQSEKEIIQNLKSGVFYLKLLVSIVDNNGEIIPAGNYKIKEINNMLVFFQGNKEYGKLKLNQFEDEEKSEYDLVYSRLDIINDKTVRIIYATISNTKCALAPVYLQN